MHWVARVAEELVSIQVWVLLWIVIIGSWRRHLKSRLMILTMWSPPLEANALIHALLLRWWLLLILWILNHVHQACQIVWLVILLVWRCGHISVEVELLFTVRLVLEVAVVLSFIWAVHLTHHVLKVVELLVAWLALGKLILLTDIHLAESLGKLTQLPFEIVSIAATELLEIVAVSAYHISQSIEYLIGIKDLLVAEVCSVLATWSNNHLIRRLLGERWETFL